ncbi:replication endonuclease, partial [Vibrio parahaemolyticus]|nr:replication endonuclease [Vibrio parahaemolyticus]
MRELVIDLASSKQEWIDFVPVHSWASCEHIPDNLFDHRFEYVDHTRNPYPEHWTPPPTYHEKIESDFNVSRSMLIPSRDVSYRLEKSGSPCDLFFSIKRHGNFTRHMTRAYTDILKTRNALEAVRAVNDAHDRLTEHGYSYAMSDEQITNLAKRKSRDFSRVLSAIPLEESQARFDKACQLLDSLGLAFSSEQIQYAENNCELFALVNRALDEHWLVRQLRR